jgi:hypothetical protein
MYAIKEGTRKIHGIEIQTFSREVISCNLLKVEAGTNGFHGGDTGAGSRTYIRIVNNGNTDIYVRPTGPCGDDGVEIMLGGDCELDTMITALEFITKVLKDQAMEVHD